jgi:hypothetical protein
MPKVTTGSLTDGQLLQRMGTNGAAWAAEFRKIALKLGYSDMDEGWLIGWFANAIEAGRGASRLDDRKPPWHDYDRDTRKCTGL